MREGSSRARCVTSPGVSTPGRPRSVREVYHPVVQDLSDQAARNGASNTEEVILSVMSTCTPRASKSSTENYSEKFYSPNPLIRQFSPEEAIKCSPTAQLCFNKHNKEFDEDLHRQRVLVSAHQRRRLQTRLRRSKSTPPGASQTTSSTDVHDKYREYWQDDDKNRLELVVTNRSHIDEKDFKERINYRLTNRTKPKSAPHGTLMSNGAPLSMVNGYTQTLIQHNPKYSQQYSNWLTNGLKVQSFRTHPLSQNYNHSHPPPPLLQYINRPKTVHGRLGVRKFYGDCSKYWSRSFYATILGLINIPLIGTGVIVFGCVYVSVCVKAREFASPPAWRFASLPAWRFASLPAWRFASLPAWRFASLPAWRFASLPAWRFASLPAWRFASLPGWRFASLPAWRFASPSAIPMFMVCYYLYLNYHQTNLERDQAAELRKTLEV